MSPIQIGTTTREVGEVVAFEFHLPISGAEGTDAKFPSLRADFIDGTTITTRGNEAVTLKVLLASLGIRQVNACHTRKIQASTRNDAAHGGAAPMSPPFSGSRAAAPAPATPILPSAAPSRVVLPA